MLGLRRGHSIFYKFTTNGALPHPPLGFAQTNKGLCPLTLAGFAILH